MPHIFEEFLNKSTFSGSTDCYFVMNCGDEIGNAENYVTTFWNLQIVKGEATNTTENNASSDKGTWANDDKGWWIEYADGSYLKDAWYQSPASGLWYYMGADGYMLTNTTTPDGYSVDGEGVWIQ